MSAPRRRRRRQPVLRIVKEEEQQQPAEAQHPEPLYASKLFRVAPLVLFTLGFIDAGYSGDWSRIGVVSSEVYAEGQAAAFRGRKRELLEGDIALGTGGYKKA